MSEVVLRQGAGERDVEALRALFLEYAESLDVSLCFQGFDRELAALPGDYAPPRGCWLLACIDGAVAGGVAVRPFAAGVCEMKRLYVRPAYRDFGLGRRLATAAVDVGRQRGYRAMCLDTLPSMAAAIALYRTLGFVETAPYYVNPLAGALYFEKPLRVSASAGAASADAR